MPSYYAKVFSEKTGLIRREVQAGSLAEAQATLHEAGFRIIAVTESGWPHRLRVSQPGRSVDHTRLAQEVHTLLDAGLSMSEALQALGRHGTGAEAEAIRKILVALRSGKRFSNAIHEVLPQAPPLLVSLIGASEQTGHLSDALERYVAYREKIDGLRKRLVTALIYPTLLLAVGALVVVFLLGFVVPRFASAYEGVVHNVPLMSRLMIEWGAIVRANGGWLLAGMTTLALLAAGKLRQIAALKGMSGLVGWHPILRARARDYSLSRFYRTIGLQVTSGIPIVRALEMASNLLSGADRTAVERSLEDLRQGRSVTDSLTEHDLAPPVVSDLLRVGERSGELGSRLIRIADFLDESVSRWMEAFIRLFEPLVMLGLGAFVACIVVLLYLPIFELAENIQ